MSGFEVIIYEKKDSIAHVTLNRPKALNAFNVKMRDELYEALGAIRDDPDVRATVIRGAGDKAFCAGADLSEFLTAPSPVIARQVRFERDVWGLFLSISKPFIAAIQGYILGSGIEIALCCDIRLCSDDAQFGLPEMNLGIIPAAGGTQTLPRAIGRAAAMEMLLTGRRINAQEALRFKLVNQVLARSELFSTVEAMAEQIAACNPDAVSYAKQAVTAGLDLTLVQGLEMEATLAKKLSALKRKSR